MKILNYYQTVTMNKPDCYKCKYRRNIPGDRHSKCVHPKVSKGNELSALMNLLGGRQEKQELHVKGSPHGIRNGWFMHPFNFDPIWLEECEGFEGTDEDEEETINQ